MLWILAWTPVILFLVGSLVLTVSAIGTCFFGNLYTSVVLFLFALWLVFSIVYLVGSMRNRHDGP